MDISIFPNFATIENAVNISLCICMYKSSCRGGYAELKIICIFSFIES